MDQASPAQHRPLDLDLVRQYVEDNIKDFHESKLKKVNELELSDLLKAKNPYLFKAKNVTSAPQIIDAILSAYISSSEESVFGDWLERLAVYVNNLVYVGRKAGVEGIDLDFDKDGVRYLVAIKSGPNWANDSQIKKMVDQFDTARARIKTSGSKANVVCVNGCCYGRYTHSRYEYKKKGDYFKYCGQRFWDLISGESELYTKLIEPIGHLAQERNNEFNEAYGRLINKMTGEFLKHFCKENGAIDWDKLVKYNSSIEGLKFPKEKEYPDDEEDYEMGIAAAPIG